MKFVFLGFFCYHFKPKHKFSYLKYLNTIIITKYFLGFFRYHGVIIFMVTNFTPKNTKCCIFLTKNFIVTNIFSIIIIFKA